MRLTRSLLYGAFVTSRDITECAALHEIPHDRLRAGKTRMDPSCRPPLLLHTIKRLRWPARPCGGPLLHTLLLHNIITAFETQRGYKYTPPLPLHPFPRPFPVGLRLDSLPFWNSCLYTPSIECHLGSWCYPLVNVVG